MAIYYLLPLFLTVGIALAINPLLLARRDTSLGRLGAIAVGIQVAFAGAAVGVTWLWITRPVEERCGDGQFDGYVALAVLYGTAILGGLVMATVVADFRRQRGLLLWHLLVSPVAIALPYAVGFALLFWALSCTS